MIISGLSHPVYRNHNQKVLYLGAASRTRKDNKNTAIEAASLGRSLI